MSRRSENYGDQENTRLRKTPGSDGLPAEFYKVLWNDKCKTLLGELKFWYGTGHFSITQRRGINKTNPQGT